MKQGAKSWGYPLIKLLQYCDVLQNDLDKLPVVTASLGRGSGVVAGTSKV